MRRMKTGIAYIGCGYVADFYQSCMPNSADMLDVRGVWDRNPDRLAQFCDFYDLRAYGSLEELLSDPDVTIIINLTNPDQHYTVSKACLEAGKHVYSEKPLAMDLDEARELVALAEEKGLLIAAAPSSVLGETAQTLWRTIRRAIGGTPRLIYAELDNGMIHRMGCETWRSISGAPWPAEDEFQTGCTMEHAGYVVSWMAAMFGPVRRIVAHSALLFPDKGIHTPENYTTPDFSVGVLEFDNGVFARITNSFARRDHRFRIFCEDGDITVPDPWNFASPVIFTPLLKTRLQRILERRLGYRRQIRQTPVRKVRIAQVKDAPNPMDFTRGPKEMAEALSAGRPSRLGGQFALHITEVALALQHREPFGTDYQVTSDFAPMEPMPWAL